MSPCAQYIIDNWYRCYQEYLSKGLTEKYSNLNTEKEKLINSANAEISSLQNKVARKFSPAEC